MCWRLAEQLCQPELLGTEFLRGSTAHLLTCVSTAGCSAPACQGSRIRCCALLAVACSNRVLWLVGVSLTCTPPRTRSSQESRLCTCRQCRGSSCAVLLPLPLAQPYLAVVVPAGGWTPLPLTRHLSCSIGETHNTQSCSFFPARPHATSGLSSAPQRQPQPQSNVVAARKRVPLRSYCLLVVHISLWVSSQRSNGGGELTAARQREPLCAARPCFSCAALRGDSAGAGCNSDGSAGARGREAGEAGRQALAVLSGGRGGRCGVCVASRAQGRAAPCYSLFKLAFPCGFLLPAAGA